MRGCLALVVLISCAHPAPPPPPCPSVVASEPEVPAEDAALRGWKAVAASGQLPADKTPAAAVAELVAYLGSPDPVRRDEVAYTLLAKWIAESLSDDELRGLRDRLVANLQKPLAGPDSVFERSFSALVLSSIVRRDVAKPFLRDDERRALLTAARDYANREIDLRGYTGAQGWAHAAAHTADLLAQLAKEPTFSDDDRAVVLDAVAGFIVRRHGQIFQYGEDGRLGVAVVFAARNGLAKPRLDAWLAAIKAPLAERGGDAFDAGLYAAQRNARNLLFTLFVQVSMVEQPNAGDKQLLDAVRTALAD